MTNKPDLITLRQLLQYFNSEKAELGIELVEDDWDHCCFFWADSRYLIPFYDYYIKELEIRPETESNTGSPIIRMSFKENLVYDDQIDECNP